MQVGVRVYTTLQKDFSSFVAQFMLSKLALLY
jgi:hypothetical protein